MSEPTCVLCPVYRPDGEPRHADGVCPADRARLERDLLALPGLLARLSDDTEDTHDRRTQPVLDACGNPTGRIHHDPVFATLPAAGVIAARTHSGDTVTGSRAAPIPINVDVHDLAAPARNAAALGPADDQIGHISVSTILDSWVRYVRDTLRPDFHLPPADAASLTGFLWRHLDDMCRYLPDVLPQLALDARFLSGAMRALLHDVDPIQRPLQGLRCDSCKHINTLVPWQTREYVECQSCGQLYTAAEREALGKRQLADVRRPRTVIASGFLHGLTTA